MRAPEPVCQCCAESEATTDYTVEHSMTENEQSMADITPFVTAFGSHRASMTPVVSSTAQISPRVLLQMPAEATTPKPLYKNLSLVSAESDLVAENSVILENSIARF